MASDFPGSPPLLKGALVVFAARVPLPTNVIVFQYNPETMSRSFAPQSSDGDEQAAPRPGAAGRTAPTYPPNETFTVSIDLDAADQLGESDPIALETGLHPTLSALELLLAPSSAALILRRTLAAAGSALLTRAEAPIVLFVWGRARVVPVRITSVGITEQAFDQALNPIVAKVELGLRTLTERELAAAGAPFDTIVIARQIAKEALARLNVVNSAQFAGVLGS